MHNIRKRMQKDKSKEEAAAANPLENGCERATDPETGKTVDAIAVYAMEQHIYAEGKLFDI